VPCRDGSPIGAAVLQHPQSFSPQNEKNKKLGMELVKYRGFKKKLFKKVMETLRVLRS